MIKLYGMTLSAHTRKVQSALIELGLPYELIVIDLMTGAQHSPDYLALNPGAKTPTLVDGDLAIFESNAILLYSGRDIRQGKAHCRECEGALADCAVAGMERVRRTWSAVASLVREDSVSHDGSATG
jgi:hypothetical protein